MPLPSERQIQNRQERVANLLDAPDLGYAYPNGLDLRPGSVFHDDLLEELLRLAHQAHGAMTPRHPEMEKMEDTMRAFIPLDEKERLSQKKDVRRPVSIVVPTTYALYDALSTQAFASYAANKELHFYRGQGPEDTIGAMLGEKIIALQTARYNELASYSTQIRDELTYGFGVVTPQWTRDIGIDVNRVPRMVMDPISGGMMPDPSGAFEEELVERVKFEGNRVRNVDPYCYLPDPNVPIHQPQDGEFVGWVTSFASRSRLLEMEYADKYDPATGEGTFFNCGYLRYLNDSIGRSAVYPARRRAQQSSANTMADGRIAPVDVIYLYVHLVPYDWALGPSQLPQKWVFAIAADKVILAARPMGLRHNQFPVAVVAADTDGYDQCPMGRLEVSYGVQTAVNFIWNSNMAFAKKALLGEFLIREEHVNVKDVLNPAAARLIRISRLAAGIPLSSAMEQLKTQPPNPNAVNDIMGLYNWMQQATGATSSIVGVMETRGERKSATEARGARNSSLGRIDKYIRLRNAQGMDDLGRLMFEQTAQLLTNKMYVEAVGRWEEELKAEYATAMNKGYIEVDPRKLSVSVDVVPMDSSNTGEDLFADWVNLYNILASNPMLTQDPRASEVPDMVRIFKHIARIGGAKNISDFFTQNPALQGQVMPPEQLQQQVQAGNLVPATEGAPSAPNRL